MYGRDYSFLRSDVGLINCKDVISVPERPTNALILFKVLFP
jgi:hypothetical protein